MSLPPTNMLWESIIQASCQGRVSDAESIILSNKNMLMNQQGIMDYTINLYYVLCASTDCARHSRGAGLSVWCVGRLNGLLCACIFDALTFRVHVHVHAHLACTWSLTALGGRDNTKDYVKKISKSEIWELIPQTWIDSPNGNWFPKRELIPRYTAYTYTYTRSWLVRGL